MASEHFASTNSDDVLTVLRDHAWDYFELHAEQRLKAFHFYILLETALLAGFLLAARGHLPDEYALFTIGLAMLFFSFVFWKIDHRTKGMIKVAEEALKVFERRAFAGDSEMVASVPFTNDPQTKGLVGYSPFGTLSYSKCFGAVFIAFAVLGIAAMIAAFFGQRPLSILLFSANAIGIDLGGYVA